MRPNRTIQAQIDEYTNDCYQLDHMYIYCKERINTMIRCKECQEVYADNEIPSEEIEFGWYDYACPNCDHHWQGPLHIGEMIDEAKDLFDWKD